MDKYLPYIIILLFFVLYYVYRYNIIGNNENFSPYAQTLIPKIYLSNTAHDNRKSCDVARFDVSGVYNRTMPDTFNTCKPYSYWNPPKNIVYIGDTERYKMNFEYQD